MHTCPVIVCQVIIPDDDLLMCGKHWYMVPKVIRNAVWDTFNDGIGIGTLALYNAQLMAIRSVNTQIGIAS